MGKIYLIASREFLSRVKKKSFIIMTLLGPLLIVGFYALIFYITLNDSLADEKKVLVVDESSQFKNQLKENEYYKFIYEDVPLEAARLQLKNEDYLAVLYIPVYGPDSLSGFKLIAGSQLSLKDEKSIEDRVNEVVKNKLFVKRGIDQKIIDEINKTDVKLISVKDSKDGEESGSTTIASTGLGFAGAILIYMFIFIYGVQITRGVMEEKTNRIVEVMISSVRPFDLMMGKILGIAMVALLQFCIWVALTSLLGGGVSGFMAMKAGMVNEASQAIQQNSEAANSFQNLNLMIGGINFPLVIGMFLFYFIGGYLFYGALFAAVGAAVDSETETQQFMLPITIPLIFAFFIAQSVVISNPNGALATWMSIIPFTSPIVMMVRVPFFTGSWDWSWGWQILASMGMMIAGIILTTWVAARIYRTGILLYGKKVTYKELGKWLFYNG